MTSECHCNHLPSIQLQLHGPLGWLNIRVGLFSVPSWALLPLAFSPSGAGAAGTVAEPTAW